MTQPDHADLIARLARYASADRSNAAEMGDAGLAGRGMLDRAATLEGAIAALGNSTIPSAPAQSKAEPEDEVSNQRHMDNEIGQDDAAASRAAPTRA